MASPTSAADMEKARQIQHACSMMEQAPDAATRSAADHFLQSFRSSARPYTLCMMLLQEESTTAQAQFVALAAMKEALRREGRLLGQAQLHALKEQLLQLVQARVHTWTRFVLKQCLHVIAVLFKWMCLAADETELRSRTPLTPAATAAAVRAGLASPAPSPSPPPSEPADASAYLSMANTVASWLQQGSTALDAGGDASSARVLFTLALELSTSLLSEFSPGGQAANAGVSVSMHVRCHARFEQHVLINLTGMVVHSCLPDLLRKLMAASQQQQPAAQITPTLLTLLHVLHSLLSFLDATLHFDFRDPKKPDALALRWALASSQGTSSGAGDDAPATSVLLRPSTQWTPILVQPQLVEMLSTAHSLLHQLLQNANGALERQWAQLPDAAHLLRNCVFQLCSLRDDVLQAPKPDSPAAAVHATAHPEERAPLKFYARLVTCIQAMLQRAVQRATTIEQMAAQRGAPAWVADAQEASGAELLDCADIVNRLLISAYLRELLCLADATLLPQLVNQVLQMSLLLIPQCVGSLRTRGGPRTVSTNTKAQEAFDVCLEVWYTIVNQAATGGTEWTMTGRPEQDVPNMALQRLEQQMQQASGMLFERYVVARVTALESNNSAAPDASVDADDDEAEEEGQFAEEGYIDEHLLNVASLGKVHMQAALQLVGSKLTHTLRAWQAHVEIMQAGGRSPTPAPSLSLYAVHELLYFLLRLLGHLLSPSSKWSELEGDSLFASLPAPILDISATEAGVQAIKGVVDAVMQLALFVSHMLEQRPAAPPGAHVPAGSSPLKECCSPLVLESMVWLLQQLLSAGYFLIDERAANSYFRPFPPALLQLYGAGSDPSHMGQDSLQVVQALIQLSGSLFTHYSEENALMEHTYQLLNLCVRHVPLRGVLQSHLLQSAPAAPGASIPLFRSLFHDSLLQLLMQDPFALMDATATISSPTASAQAKSAASSLLHSYNSLPFSNLAPALIADLSHVLIQSMLFKPEDHSSLSTAQCAHQRAQSIQLIHLMLLPLSRTFYSVTLHPSFPSVRSRAAIVKCLSNLVAFFSGMVRTLHTDYFEYLWGWITMTERAASVAASSGGNGVSDIERGIQAHAKEVTAQVHALRAARRQQGASISSASSLAAAQAQTLPGARNILQGMVDLVRAYNAPDSSSTASLSDSASLELLSGVLSFFTALCGSFLSHLDVQQSYRFMQASLGLVNGFTEMMEKRTSAAALQLRQANGSTAASAATSAKRNKNAALANDLSLLEEVEWASLKGLLQLLEGLSWKDLADLSAESVEFASDAVLQGLVLLVPRLAGGGISGAGGGMLAQPEVALLFFELLSNLVASNADKLVVALSDAQRGQLMHMIQVVLQPPPQVHAGASPEPGSPAASIRDSSAAAAAATLFGRTTAQLHSKLLKEACLAVQSLAQYHLYFASGRAEADRAEAAQEDAAWAAQPAPTSVEEASRRDAARRAQLQARPPPPPPSPYGPALAVFLESLLHLLSFAPVGSAALEAVADALLPTVLCQPAHMTALVQRVMTQWRAGQMARLQQQQAAATLDPATAQQQVAEVDRLTADLEASFRTLLPSAPPRKGAVMGSILSAVNGRFSSVSSSALMVERGQRMAYRQQVRTFVLTARPMLAIT